MLTRCILAALSALILLPLYAHAQEPNQYTHNEWNDLLNKYVVNLPGNHATQVNYAGISSDHALLDSYLAKTSRVSKAQFDHWSKNEQLAFLINTYNAWTIKLVIENYKNIKSIKDLGGMFKSPWKKEFISLFGNTISLDEIEHQLIRGSDRYKDFRIHFAVNCASIGCPALRNEAYSADRLNAQLENQTQVFLGDSNRNRIENNTLYLSPIFKWYLADFQKGWLGVSNLFDFLARYSSSISLSQSQLVALQNGDIDIKYLEYNWNLNGLEP